MRDWRLYHTAALAAALLSFPCFGQVYISEFLTDNAVGIADEDGDQEDWIELWNSSTQAVDLTGWALTDAKSDSRKWSLPSFVLPAGGRRIIFASSKNRRNPLGTLHTNFKLDRGGEYLALVRPDNLKATELDPYPAQVTDIAYGLTGVTNTALLVQLGAAARWQVPVSSNEYVTAFTGWTNIVFADGGWSNALTGVGYDTDVTYGPLIGAGGNTASRNQNINGSVFLRVPFVVDDPARIASLRYLSKHDDGFVVWLNGQLVVAESAPAALTWNSFATANRDETFNSNWTYYPLTNAHTFLQAGTNVLAIQGLNVNLTSSDLLVAPQLEASYVAGVTTYGYLVTPTPGSVNGVASTNIGPVVSGVTDRPIRPLGTGVSPDLVITAKVASTLRPLGTNGVRLHWRIQYGAESITTMTLQAVGVYTAAIPTIGVAPGQMLRWRVIASDTAGYSNAAPRFVDPLDHDQYYGTVALDPALTNGRLPVLHFFCTNFAAAQTAGGTRCALFFLDRFYDNVEVNLHGQTSSTFPKKPYDFDFNDGNRFILREGEDPVKDVNMLTTYADKTKARNTLAHDTLKAVGAAHLMVETVRVQTNGSFAGIWDLVEDGDDRWLERLGLNVGGALYKMYNFLNATNATTVEKKWPQDQDRGDLQAFINGIHPAQTIETRRRFAYDQVNLPDCVSYLVGRSLISDTDHGHKNYYVYRDTGITDAWSLFPWDVDLSFGHTWTGTYFDDRLFQTNPVAFPITNWLYQIIYQAPELNQMVLRRYRTVMDRVLQPPGTSPTNGWWERRLDAIADQVDPPGITNSDAILDWQKWGTWGGSTNNFPARQDIARVKSVHVPGRRDFLFNQNPLSSGQPIPPSQPAAPSILFGVSDPLPASGRGLEEYFTLVNTNAHAVDLSGWTITGGVSFTFAPGTVLPAGGGATQFIGQLHVARSPRDFRARATGPRSNEFRFITGPYSGQISARGETLYLATDEGLPVAILQTPATPTRAQQDLRVTEIHYNPAAPSPSELAAIPYLIRSDFEFIELQNIGTNTLDLGGTALSEGIAFTVPTNTLLAPGSFLVIAANTNALLLRYGAVTGVVGVYEGLLDNGGERIQILDPSGEMVQDFSFNNTWWPMTDGPGFSLVPVDPSAGWDEAGDAAYWRASARVGGSPGAADGTPEDIPVVRVEEVLAHTDPPDEDAIELFNPGVAPVSIGGWFLTDDFATPMKYRISTGTVLAAGARIVFTESNFNQPTNAQTSFRLNSTGDDVWLFSANAATQLTGYVHGWSFGASVNGSALIRYANSAGDLYYPAAAVATLGAVNAYPRMGSILIRELAPHTNPALSYIEVQNPGAVDVALHDPAFPTNTWRLRGSFDFDWPAGSVLSASASVVVVGFDPANTGEVATFRSVFPTAPANRLVGPASGVLDPQGGSVKLQRPDEPNPGEVPMITMEEIRYQSNAPWPVPGAGQTLQRIDINGFAGEPLNWFSADARPGSAPDLSQDTDDDGAPDWAEQLAGTNPNQSDRGIGMKGSETTPSVRWAGILGRLYVLERSTNLLANPPFSPVSTQRATGNAEIELPLSTDGVYRIRLQIP